MTLQKSSGIRFILLGLIAAFLHSVLISPSANSGEKDNQKRDLTISQSGSGHSSQNDPISLPGEEKEEEYQAEKDSKLTLDLHYSSMEYYLGMRGETVCFSVARPQDVLAANIPIYLLKKSFII